MKTSKGYNGVRKINLQKGEKRKDFHDEKISLF